MKKTILTLVVALMASVNAMAGSDLKMESGSVKELKGSGATICAVWDYSKSTIEDKSIKEFLKEKGADWERDYPAEIKRAEENFIERLNDKAKKNFTAVSGNDADYKLVIKVKNFNYGSTGASMWVGFGAGDARIYGKMELYKKGEAKPLATFDLDGVSGSGGGNEQRRVEAYRELAELFCDIVKKGK
jgi:hypothetical protein